MRSFANLTGLRNITFNGKNSLIHFNILITKNTKVHDTKPRTPSIKLPYRQGRVRASRASGVLMFDERVLTYEFKIIEDTPAALRAKISQVSTWLYSHDTDTITDSFETGYYFDDCECTNIKVTNKSEGYLNIAYLTATFTAYPFKKSTTQGGADVV